MVGQMMPPLIRPMQFRLTPHLLASVDVAQIHRFLEFLQGPRQTARQEDRSETRATVRAGFTFSIIISRMLLGFW